MSSSGAFERTHWGHRLAGAPFLQSQINLRNLHPLSGSLQFGVL